MSPAAAATLPTAATTTASPDLSAAATAATPPVAAATPAAPTFSAPPARRVAAAWTAWHTGALLASTGALALVGLALPAVPVAASYQPALRLGTWLLTAALLTSFALIAGHGLTGRWRGALIDPRNKMSLSRLQMLLWTLIALSGFLAAALANIHAGRGDSLNITIPSDVWALMGITTTALVGSPLILSQKRAQSADTAQAAQTIKHLVPDAATVARQADGQVCGTAASGYAVKHRGRVIVNTCARDAQWSDLFRGDETGNAASLDLGKMQMFYFTLIVALAYTVALGALFVHAAGPITAFPPLSQSMVALLALSNAGYLTNKALPHSDGASA